jgi:hypothetical protein
MIRKINLIIVLINGRHRFRKIAIADRSFTGRSGATPNCTTMIEVTPDITAVAMK